MNTFQINKEKESLLFWKEQTLVLAKRSLELYLKFKDDSFKDHARFFIGSSNRLKDKLKRL